MDLEAFDWDQVNLGHIARHTVSPEEAEEAVTLDPVEVDYQNVEGEERIGLIGLTTGGRFITVVLTIRYDK